MKAVFSVVAELVEELLVCFFQQLFECQQIWQAKNPPFAAAQKYVDTLTICCRVVKPLHAGDA